MAEFLEQLSQALGETVEAVKASVVRVEGRRRLAATGIVWSADGVIVTANHVVERDENVRVALSDGRIVDAVVVGRDRNTDLAVLRVEGANLTVPTWAGLDDVKVGHLVLALGRAGESLQASLGVVSAVGEFVEHGRSRSRRRSMESKDRFIQTDVTMYPGFSGGPLVDASGKIRGLNTSIMRGTSLAIPTATIQRVTETLLTYGRIRRGYLGVTSQAVALPKPLQAELEQETGLLVLATEVDGPAERGGIVLGDTIVGLDGSSIADLDDLMALLSSERVGQTVSVRVIRGGELKELQVTIGERP